MVLENPSNDSQNGHSGRSGTGYLDQTNRTLVYTPIQVFLATLLGGPFVGIYMLGVNFRAMGKGRVARQLWILGPAIIVIFLVILFSLVWPFGLLRSLPIIFALISLRIVTTRQMSKGEIMASGTHEPASNLQVAAIAFLGLVTSMALLYLGAIATLRFSHH